jgi:hypothetical protein
MYSKKNFKKEWPMLPNSNIGRRKNKREVRYVEIMAALADCRRGANLTEFKMGQELVFLSTLLETP